MGYWWCYCCILWSHFDCNLHPLILWMVTTLITIPLLSERGCKSLDCCHCNICTPIEIFHSMAAAAIFSKPINVLSHSLDTPLFRELFV